MKFEFFLLFVLISLIQVHVHVLMLAKSALLSPVISVHVHVVITFKVHVLQYFFCNTMYIYRDVMYMRYNIHVQCMYFNIQRQEETG